MILDTNQMVSMTEANQNFSKVVKLADKAGTAVILRNNKPRYLVVSLADNPFFDLTDDEKIDVLAKRLLEKRRSAYEELAK